MSPVTVVTVRLEDESSFTVPVNDRGFFILPPNRIATPGPYTAELTAISITGRRTMTRVEID